MSEIEPSAPAAVSAMTHVASSAAAQEIQAALVMADARPRSVPKSLERIREAFRRPGLAEMGLYSYPKGGQRIEDLSIRSAEALAQCWGNMRVGTVEIDKRPEMGERSGESTLEAYAWDLETNMRTSRTFTTPHERYSKEHGVTRLSEQRDVYEVTANQASRRLRACILAAIPSDVVDVARQTIYETLRGDGTEPRENKIRAMKASFKRDFDVSLEQIEAWLGHNVAATTDHELVRLRGVFASLSDGFSGVAQHFPPLAGAAPGPASSLSEAAAALDGSTAAGEEGGGAPAQAADSAEGSVGLSAPDARSTEGAPVDDATPAADDSWEATKERWDAKESARIDKLDAAAGQDAGDEQTDLFQ